MICKLKGVVQHYKWGGYDFIPSLMKQKNEPRQPWAEYWLGIHPKGSALVNIEGKWEELSAVLGRHPEYLGDEVQQKFGELPFLFKILDVRQMLSIQLHPTKSNAAAGFAKEEQKGIPRLAPHRNYKDENHKPEVMVALTDFWLLHGFKDQVAIAESLSSVPAWSSLADRYVGGGTESFYHYIMSLSQKKTDKLLESLYGQLKQKLLDNPGVFGKENPDYWAWQAFQHYTHDGHYDRGIFSIYLFNIVNVKEGEGIFQESGVPHAYLEGINIELMANSDNVLRGGLTSKHIDVPELLDNIKTASVIPTILRPKTNEKGMANYYVPCGDFSLDKITLLAAKQLSIQQNGPAIYLLMEGNVTVNDRLYQLGEAFFVSDKTALILENRADSPVVFYRAYV